MTRRFFSDSGTSPSTMRRARPSTMAVLPTPGSPMSTGLFLVRRDSTWMTRRISSSRPMTGSSLPRRASSVRSRPYFSSAWYLSSGFWLDDPMRAPHLAHAVSSCSRGTLMRSAERQEQVLGREVLVAQLDCGRRRPPRGGRGAHGADPDLAAVGTRQLGRWRRRPDCAATSGLTPTRCRIGSTTPSCWPSRAASRWSSVTSGLLRALANSVAAVKASWVFIVQRSGFSDTSILLGE